MQPYGIVFSLTESWKDWFCLLQLSILTLAKFPKPVSQSLCLLGVSGEPLRVGVGGGALWMLCVNCSSLRQASLFTFSLAFPDTFILHLLRQNWESALTHCTQDLKSGQTETQFQPGSCQAEAGIVASEDWLWIAPLCPGFPGTLHFAWLSSYIIKAVVIFLTGLQTLISFHSEYPVHIRN